MSTQSKQSFDFILASASQRRKELLEQAQITSFIIEPVDIDESPKKDELPLAYTKRIAYEKAVAARNKHPGEFILTADTIAAVGRRILLKPKDAAEEERFLRLLSGRSNTVFTAICLVKKDGSIITRTVTTKLKFKRLSEAEIKLYIKSGQWEGKSGGYAIQGLVECFVKGINGSISNIIGLPLYETKNLLEGVGVIKYA